MGLGSLFVLAVGLSMDAFAVAICKGLAIGHPSLKASVTAGLWFGIFQALMPLIGYFIGIQFASLVSAFDHWIAFVLLLCIGALSAIGVRVGAVAGSKYRSKAELAGGIILIAIGLKILLEHLIEGI